MKITKTLVLALAVLGVASFSIAQKAGPAGGVKPGKGGQGQRGPGGAGMMARLGEIEDKALTKAGATADEKKKVAALREKEKPAREAFMKKVQEEMKKNAPTGGKPAEGQRRPQLPADLMEEGKKMNDAHQAAMKKILGDAKFKKFQEALQEERKALGGGRFGGGQGQGQRGGAGGKTPPPQN